jgi:hypothetical protein
MEQSLPDPRTDLELLLVISTWYSRPCINESWIPSCYHRITRLPLPRTVRAPACYSSHNSPNSPSYLSDRCIDLTTVVRSEHRSSHLTLYSISMQLILYSVVDDRIRTGRTHWVPEAPKAEQENLGFPPPCQGLPRLIWTLNAKVLRVTVPLLSSLQQSRKGCLWGWQGFALNEVRRWRSPSYVTRGGQRISGP